MSKLNRDLWNVIPPLRKPKGGRTSTETAGSSVIAEQNSINVMLDSSVKKVAKGDIICIYNVPELDSETALSGLAFLQNPFVKMNPKGDPLFEKSSEPAYFDTLGISLDNYESEDELSEDNAIIKVQYKGIFDYDMVRTKNENDTKTNLYNFVSGRKVFVGKDNLSETNGLFQYTFETKSMPAWIATLKLLTSIGTAISKTKIVLNIENCMINP